MRRSPALLVSTGPFRVWRYFFFWPSRCFTAFVTVELMSFCTWATDFSHGAFFVNCSQGLFFVNCSQGLFFVNCSHGEFFVRSSHVGSPVNTAPPPRLIPCLGVAQGEQLTVVLVSAEAGAASANANGAATSAAATVVLTRRLLTAECFPM